MSDSNAPDRMEETKSVDPDTEAELRKFAAEMGGMEAPEDEPDSGPDPMEQTAGVTDEMEAELRKFAMDMGSDDQLRAMPREAATKKPHPVDPMERAIPGGVRKASGRTPTENDEEKTTTVNEATETELRRFAMEMKERFSQPVAEDAGRKLTSMEQTTSVSDADEAELRKFAMQMKTNFNDFSERIRGAGSDDSDGPEVGEKTQSVDEATEAELRKFAMDMGSDFAGAAPGSKKMEETVGMDDDMKKKLEEMGDPFADLSEDDLPTA